MLHFSAMSNAILELAKFYLFKLTSFNQTSQFKLDKIQAVLSQINDYSPVSVEVVQSLD